MKKQYNLRIKTVTQKIRRMKKKIASLENVLEAIKQKNFLEEEQLYNLKGISIGNVDLLKRVVYKSKGKLLSQKYSPELRKFALTLHYFSPRAYLYVRETFNSCLPHPKTLYKWYRSVDGEPGFNKEAFAFIKERVSKTNCLLFGALMMDEMAIRQKLEECKQYLVTLRLEDGQLLVNSKRKTGFLGFLINIENLKMLYQYVCQNELLLPYIPLYQQSQDHLEIFFGCIRAFGGQNNNPSTRLFKTAFKRMLVRTEIKGATTGNCTELAHIPILTASSKPEEIINTTSSIRRMIDYECEYDKYTNNTVLEFDHSYVLSVNNTSLSEYCQEVISYIAGFIVRYLTKHIICEICVQALTDNNKTGTLIRLKDRGSLFYPSQSVVNICKETEKVIRFNTKEQHAIISNTYNANYVAYCVLRHLNMNNIFTDLITHSNDQNIITCHRVQLVKSIILKYVKTRYFYIGKTTDTTISNRHFYNKLILFAGK
ncbi:THAP domain-containing protein 9 [Cyphomyrmex costatus]|uniref:THAP domain-containing protein 9 n=1 Tax=Cyphomyrmex costatus TaxID=456900 RepID=A0A151IK33_9HYME|nr:THAP domain-containing protein 9 [Cyphomyrmex costatus]